MISDMTKGNPLKLILSFSVPMLIGNIFQQLYSMVDTIIVGRFVGVNALAALGACNSLFFLVNGLVLGLTSGFAVLVAQKFGAKDEKGVKKAVASNITLTIVLTVIITIVALLAVKPLLNMMNTPENIYEDARVYITLIYAGIITQTGYNMAAGILRALGDSKTPLYFLIVASILNVILDLIFIINFNMGVAGAALSTLFSRALSAIVIFYYLRKPRQVVVVKDYLQIRPDMPLIMKILAIGVPAGIENGMFQFGKLAIQSTVSTMGTVAIAAQAMANILEMVNGIFGVGVGIGLMTMVGQAIGAGRREEAKFYVVRCTQIGLVGILVSCLLVLAATKPILWIAGMEAESAAMCFDMVVAITIAKPLFWTFSFIPAYGMRAAGDVKFSMITSTITMWCLRVALCIFLVRQYHMGPMAVWYGMFADWAVRGVIFFIRFKSGKWLHSKVV